MTYVMNPTVGFLADIGTGEVLVILAALLLLFGGKGLPSIARKLGQITHNLQKAAQDFKKQILTADYPPPADDPKKTPEPSHDHDADKS